MREYVGGYKFSELPDWITYAHFYCIKNGDYLDISMADEICPICCPARLSEQEKHKFKELQEDTFKIGIQILKAIDKTRNDDKKLLEKTKEIIRDVLYNRFLIEQNIKFNKKIKLTKALKYHSQGENHNEFGKSPFKFAETYYELKEAFGQYICDVYNWLYGGTDEIFAEKKIKGVLEFYKGQYADGGTQRHIKKFEVRGLFGYHSYDLNMTTDSLSTVIGTNGLGKTTIFRVVESLLGGEKESFTFLFDIPFEEISVCFVNGGYIKLKQERNDTGQVAITINSKRESSFTTSIDEPVQIMNYDAEGWDKYCKCIKHVFPEVFYKEKRFLFVKTKRLTANEIKNKMEKIISEKGNKNNFKFFNECFKSLYYEKDPSKKQIKIVDGKLSIETSKKVFDKEGKFEKVLDFNPKYLPKNKDVRGGDLLELENLSSGEINVLAILFEIWFMAKPGAMVLIDEPEISLHIAWQQRMGEIISEMVKKKKGVQVIVATHSPFLAASTPDSIVEAKLNK